MTATDFEASTFQNRPAYRYIRKADRLPTTAEARAEADPLIRIKLFNPTGRGTWYIAGYDPETRLAFGAADILELERGDFDMAEIVALRPAGTLQGFGQFRLPLERDLYFTPCPMSECSGK